MATNYFVATTGNDVNPGTQGSPKQTIKNAVALTAPDDTVQIRGGTYTDSIDVQVGDTIPSGTSGHPIIITAFQGEPVTVAPTGHTRNAVFFLSGTSYTTWRNMVLDGTGLVLDHLTGVLRMTASSSHNRFESIEVKNSPGDGIDVAGTSNFNTFLNCDSHDSGTFDARGHGIYIAGGTPTDTLIDGGRYYNNAKYGIHQYNAGSGGMDRTIIRNLRVYHNGYVGATPTTSISCWGLLLGDGLDLSCYNCIFYENTAGAIQLNFVANDRTSIYNNTCYNNSNDATAGPGYGSPTMEVGGGVYNCLIRNNIMYGNYSNTIDSSGAGAGYAASNNPTSNPGFVDSATKDFRLLVGAAARGAGLDLTSTGILTTDLLGHARPNGSAWDVGAYQYANLSTIFNGFLGL